MMTKVQNNSTPSPHVSPDILTHPERRLRLPEVKAMTGYSTSSIYSRMSKSTFPQGQKMGGRAIAWRLQDILDFLNGQPSSYLPKEVA
jgi:prophage regulatory protein